MTIESRAEPLQDDFAREAQTGAHRTQRELQLERHTRERHVVAQREHCHCAELAARPRAGHWLLERAARLAVGVGVVTPVLEERALRRGRAHRQWRRERHRVIVSRRAEQLRHHEDHRHRGVRAVNCVRAGETGGDVRAGESLSEQLEQPRGHCVRILLLQEEEQLARDASQLRVPVNRT